MWGELVGELPAQGQIMRTFHYLTSYWCDSDGGRKGLEETELSAKIAQLNKDLARAAEDLTRAMHVSAETEAVALQVCEIVFLSPSAWQQD